MNQERREKLHATTKEILELLDGSDLEAHEQLEVCSAALGITFTATCILPNALKPMLIPAVVEFVKRDLEWMVSEEGKMNVEKRGEV